MRRPSVQTFASPTEFFEAVLGPSQHDAHVVRRTQVLHSAQMLADADAGIERANAEAALIIASFRRAA